MQRSIRRAAGLLCLLLALPAATFAEGTTFAQVRGNDWVRLRNGPGEEYDCVATMPGGTDVRVLEEADGWALIESRRGVTYIKSSQIEKREEKPEAAEAIPAKEASKVCVQDFKAPAMIRGKAGVRLGGTILADGPILEVEAEVYDERLLYVERIVRLRYDAGQGVQKVDLASLYIPFSELTPGEKTLTIYARHAGGREAVAEAPFTVLGQAAEPTHITAWCEVETAQGNVEALLDDRPRTVWTPLNETDAVTVRLPEGVTAGGISVEWMAPTGGARLTCRDAEGNVLEELSADGRYVNEWFDLDERTREVTLQSGDGTPVSELRVYEKGRVPSMVQRWQPLAEKVDLMVFSAHQDDELIFFGGTIPFYADAGKEVAVVYMADCGRTRYAEALSGLWASGLKKHPLFLGLTDKRAKTFQIAQELWDGEQALQKTVEVLRRYRPEVVVTHDVKGEYGHNQHKYTQSLVSRAVELAADPEAYPESARQYGAYQVKKLYIHLLKEGEVVMDWTKPLASQGGRSAIEMATIGYDKHVSQQGYYSMGTGNRYDNRAYGLRMSTVGPDVRKDDFFENL